MSWVPRNSEWNAAAILNQQKSASNAEGSWDNYYQNDLDHNGEGDEGPADLSELESWFDDVGAPAKTLSFLTSLSFPLSPESLGKPHSHASVLDVGTGNGSVLFSLCLQGGYRGRMVGVDYSERSVILARKLWQQYYSSSLQIDGVEPNLSVSFDVFDLIRDDPATSPWWPHREGGFDLVLDKGTFDAISLSSETVTEADGKRLCEVYPAIVASMVRPGGFFLITSCNWTQDEVIRWFTTGDLQNALTIYHIIKYPVFRFGGQSGQGVVSICFRKLGAP